MSNYTILEQNTLAGFEHDDTKELYLRGAARDEQRAFLMAGTWERQLRPFLGVAVQLAAKVVHDQQPENPHLRPCDQVAEEVLTFIRERHFRSHFPDGRKA
jgi:hypothetical protein